MNDTEAFKTFVALLECIIAELQRKGILTAQEVEGIYNEAMRRALHENSGTPRSSLWSRVRMT